MQDGLKKIESPLFLQPAYILRPFRPSVISVDIGAVVRLSAPSLPGHHGVEGPCPQSPGREGARGLSVPVGHSSGHQLSPLSPLFFLLKLV